MALRHRASIGWRCARIAVAVAAGMCLFSATTAMAGDWLVLVVDRSNSIDADELALQRQAYVDVLNDDRVISALGETLVAIVEFDNTAQVVVPWTTAPQAAWQYANQSAGGSRGGTGIGRGLRAAMDLLADKSGRRVIDVSGDGRENRDSVLLDRMRATATTDGVTINGLTLIGRTHYNLRQYYRERVANGFVMQIDDIADFHAALRRKILREMMVSQRQVD